MIPFNFHHLYYFYAIAQAGSVSQAAKELRLSQPALSYQLKHLEKYLSVTLFERKGRKLILTEEGHSALSYAKQIFDVGKEFVDGLRDRSQKGRIRIQIGVSNSIPKTFANALLKFILKIEPETHILLHEDTLDQMIENLKDHLLDVVLSDMPFQASNEEGIQNHLIGRIPIVFCAHPLVAKKIKNFPKDLAGAPMILPTSHSRLFHSVQEFFVSRSIAPKIIAEIQDVELIHRMVLEGIGIAPLNKFSILHTPFRKQLTILDKNTRHDIHDSIYLITKVRKNTHPLVEKIVEGFRLIA